MKMQPKEQDEEKKRQLVSSLLYPYYRYRTQAQPGRCKLKAENEQEGV
jgi:hypothetical protein